MSFLTTKPSTKQNNNLTFNCFTFEKHSRFEKKTKTQLNKHKSKGPVMGHVQSYKVITSDYNYN